MDKSKSRHSSDDPTLNWSREEREKERENEKDAIMSVREKERKRRSEQKTNRLSAPFAHFKKRKK